VRPSIRQLEYLVALAAARHFGRAARACAVTQPALSLQIRQLEELLGVKLFERGRRSVLITPAGERVILRAREALQRIDDLVDEARAAQRPFTGRLSLGVIPTVAPYLLPRALPAVRKAWPRLELLLREDQTQRILARLRAGELELLLLALPVEGEDLERLPLFEEPFVLALPATHPLASQHGPVTEAALAGEPVVLLEEGHCLRDQALALCDAAGARETGRVQATSLGTLVQMVANGLGITLLPATAVEVEARPGSGIALRRFAAPGPGRNIGLVWRRGSARRAEFRALGEIFTRCAPPLARWRAAPAGRATRESADAQRAAGERSSSRASASSSRSGSRRSRGSDRRRRPATARAR
jgi:LysR family hydrogen peroxide-inducible transcriptional activator